eukprot:TRINITY_DN9515_c0_g1_i1.p1 TRINITY_DN9515_c0_g1~~TRINITY_DN9515_c0_g1_i1.p1  ORF type:complete len:273 (-),score=30.37 TRINITY_DN9515_c0_g1_i1:51-869(-)
MSICAVCSKTFESVSKLSYHFKTVHSEDRPYKCHHKDCDKAYKKKSHLKIHVDSKHECVKHVCGFCGKEMSSSSSLRRHIKTIHEIKKPFECTWEKCCESFASEKLLLKHMSVHTGKLPYICTFPGCDRSFAYPVYLRNHIQRHHDSSSSSNTANDERLLCEKCGETFKTQSTLKAHIQYKHSEEKLLFPCSLCDKQFTMEKNLKVHVSRSHLKEKPFECQFCHKKFGYNSSLKRHITNIHSDVQDLVCRKRNYSENTEQSAFEPSKRRLIQ